jgi:hypothetical protein
LKHIRHDAICKWLDLAFKLANYGLCREKSDIRIEKVEVMTDDQDATEIALELVPVGSVVDAEDLVLHS